MKIVDIISSLKRSRKIKIECPCCQSLHLAKDLDLFTEDSFTADAQFFLQQQKEVLIEMRDELERLKTKKPERIMIGAKASNHGKLIEKFAPLLPGFKGRPEDSIPLLDPIDFVVFDGLINGAISSIRFLDIKTGDGRLNAIQKSVKKSISNGNIEFQTLRAGKSK